MAFDAFKVILGHNFGQWWLGQTQTFSFSGISVSRGIFDICMHFAFSLFLWAFWVFGMHFLELLLGLWQQGLRTWHGTFILKVEEHIKTGVFTSGRTEKEQAGIQLASSRTLYPSFLPIHQRKPSDLWLFQKESDSQASTSVPPLPLFSLFQFHPTAQKAQSIPICCLFFYPHWYGGRENGMRICSERHAALCDCMGACLRKWANRLTTLNLCWDSCQEREAQAWQWLPQWLWDDWEGQMEETLFLSLNP